MTPIMTSLDRLWWNKGVDVIPDSTFKKSQDLVVCSWRSGSGKIDTISSWPALPQFHLYYLHDLSFYPQFTVY